MIEDDQQRCSRPHRLSPYADSSPAKEVNLLEDSYEGSPDQGEASPTHPHFDNSTRESSQSCSQVRIHAQDALSGTHPPNFSKGNDLDHHPPTPQKYSVLSDSVMVSILSQSCANSYAQDKSLTPTHSPLATADQDSNKWSQGDKLSSLAQDKENLSSNEVPHSIQFHGRLSLDPSFERPHLKCPLLRSHKSLIKSVCSTSRKSISTRAPVERSRRSLSQFSRISQGRSGATTQRVPLSKGKPTAQLTLAEQIIKKMLVSSISLQKTQLAQAQALVEKTRFRLNEKSEKSIIDPCKAINTFREQWPKLLSMLERWKCLAQQAEEQRKMAEKSAKMHLKMAAAAQILAEKAVEAAILKRQWLQHKQNDEGTLAQIGDHGLEALRHLLQFTGRHARAFDAEGIIACLAELGAHPDGAVEQTFVLAKLRSDLKARKQEQKKVIQDYEQRIQALKARISRIKSKADLRNSQV